MVINAAAFIDDKNAAAEMIYLTKIRDTALDIAHSIDGYKDADRTTKNFIYDEITKALKRI